MTASKEPQLDVPTVRLAMKIILFFLFQLHTSQGSTVEIPVEITPKAVSIWAVEGHHVTKREANECPGCYPYAYHNGGHCCKTNKEKTDGRNGDLCDGSELGRDSVCCEGDNQTQCPGGNCVNYQQLQRQPDRCPITHPYAYRNGGYCCATKKEKNSEGGTQCDGGELEKDSVCCEGDRWIECSCGACDDYKKAEGMYTEIILTESNSSRSSEQ